MTDFQLNSNQIKKINKNKYGLSSVKIKYRHQLDHLTVFCYGQDHLKKKTLKEYLGISNMFLRKRKIFIGIDPINLNSPKTT